MLEDPTANEEGQWKAETTTASEKEFSGPIFPPSASHIPPSTSGTAKSKASVIDKCVIPPPRDRTPMALTQQRYLSVGRRKYGEGRIVEGSGSR